MRGRHGRSHRYIGHPPKNPGVIAPEYLTMFAGVAHPRKRVYLAAYVQERGDQIRSRRTAGGGSQHCYWLRDDPEYRAAYERARRAVAAAPKSNETLKALLSRLGRTDRARGGRW